MNSYNFLWYNEINMLQWHLVSLFFFSRRPHRLTRMLKKRMCGHIFLSFFQAMHETLFYEGLSRPTLETSCFPVVQQTHLLSSLHASCRVPRVIQRPLPVALMVLSRLPLQDDEVVRRVFHSRRCRRQCP